MTIINNIDFDGSKNVTIIEDLVINIGGDQTSMAEKSPMCRQQLMLTNTAANFNNFSNVDEGN